MENHAQLIYKIDEQVLKTRSIIDNFHELLEDPEIDDKTLLRVVSKNLMAIDYTLLELLRNLKADTTKYFERRTVNKTKS